MAVGDIIKHYFSEYSDNYTGRKVTRLTNTGTLHHHPYFYYKMLTNDDRYLIHAGLYNGKRQLYRMDMENGESMQLTDHDEIEDFGCSLTSDDRYLFYSRAQKVVRLDLESGEEDVIYETPPGWFSNGNPGISTDDRHLVIVEMNDDGRIHDQSGWSTFEKQWALKPLCRIVVIDAERRSGKVIYEDRCWLGHPQFRPGDNHTLLFCHEGPSHCIDARLWLIDGDGSNVRCARPQVPGEHVTHEYWLHDGSKFCFVHREPGGGKATIRLIDPATLDEEVLMECSHYCHFMSNRNHTFIAGDGQPVDQSYIYLVDVHRRREQIICEHNTSWTAYGNNQDSHPHPAFSSDGSFLVFTSDREGLPGIYKVMIDDLIEEESG